MKWSQISGTVVHLKILLGVELVPVVMSKQNPFCGSVGGLKWVANIISPSGSRLAITTHKELFDSLSWETLTKPSIMYISPEHQNLRSAYVNHVPH